MAHAESLPTITRPPLPSLPTLFRSAAKRATLPSMAATAAPDSVAEDRLAREEERLARAAAAGDGHAFATLYERYEARAYNLAVRVTGSADDAADATQDAFVKVMRRLPAIGDREQLNFGSYLFTATRNACYDLMRKQQRTRPTDEIPESAVPVGAGVGAADPGDPDDDPDRNVIVQAQLRPASCITSRLRRQVSHLAMCWSSQARAAEGTRGAAKATAAAAAVAVAVGTPLPHRRIHRLQWLSRIRRQSSTSRPGSQIPSPPRIPAPAGPVQRSADLTPGDQ